MLIRFVLIVICVLTMSCFKSESDLGVTQDTGIRFNFFDLPNNYLDSLKSTLESNDINQLNDVGLKNLQVFIENSIIQGTRSNNILGNYFWSVLYNLPEFVEEKNNGYYWESEKQLINEKLKSYAIYRIARDQKNITRIYEIFKPWVESLVSKEYADSIGVTSFITQRIRVLDTLQKLDFKNPFDNVSNFLDSATGVWRQVENSHYYDTVTNGNAMTADELNYMLYQELVKYNTSFEVVNLTGYDFWFRRYREDNIDVVYSILKDLEQLFSDE
ncbi:MAG: hypothetical protein OCC49_18370 [Fibrobacterales bacterium]